MTMGRKRRDRKDLPERVYFKHGAYYFVDKGGKWHSLGKDYSKALAKYADLNNSGTGFSMGAIMDRYLREIVPTKSPRTQKNYEQEMKRLKAGFGLMLPGDITPPDIYAYMDERPPIAGNREKALLSTVFSYAVRWGLASDNPCRLVKRNPESPRDRYVEDWEYQFVYKMASPMIQIAMDVARMTGLRQGDIVRLKLTDVKDMGLHVHTGKTKKRMIYELTPELEAVIARSRSIPIEGVQPLHPYLIRNEQGRGYTPNGFRTVWQKLMNRAQAVKGPDEKPILTERFTFHDLRGKAASESENASELLGHDDPKTTNRVYRRAPRRVTPVKY